VAAEQHAALQDRLIRCNVTTGYEVPHLRTDGMLVCCSVLNADSSDPLSVSMTGIDTELRR
jgi:hypothetical protein